MTISNALIADLPAILALQKSCYLEEAVLYNEFNLPPLTQSLEEIQVEIEATLFLKLVVEHKLIGSVRAIQEGNTCKIGRLIVHESVRNLGYGRRLMNEIEKRFPSVARFELFTGHKSVKNLALYQKIGYQPFKKQKINDNLTLIYLEKLNSIL